MRSWNSVTLTELNEEGDNKKGSQTGCPISTWEEPAHCIVNGFGLLLSRNLDQHKYQHSWYQNWYLTVSLWRIVSEMASKSGGSSSNAISRSDRHIMLIMNCHELAKPRLTVSCCTYVRMQTIQFYPGLIRFERELRSTLLMVTFYHRPSLCVCVLAIFTVVCGTSNIFL